MVEAGATPISNAQRLDPVSLEKGGLTKVSLFLREFLEGVAQDKQPILLDIPFLVGESDTTNQKNLFFLPSTSLPQDGQVPAISLLQIASLLDEIADWLQVAYGENDTIKRATEIPLFLEPVVRDQRDIKEQELLEQQFRNLIEQKAAVLLQTILQLSSELPASETKDEQPTIQNKGVDTNRVLDAFTNLTPTTSETISAKTATVSQVGEIDSVNSTSEAATIYRRQVDTYEVISLNAGFLYNQIVSNIYNIYGLTPGELPPEIEYQLRQSILSELYRLKPSDLSQGGSLSLNRLKLGRLLFEKIILHNPAIFVQIEKSIENQAQARGIALKVSDPLKLWAEQGSVEQLEVWRQVGVRVFQLDQDSQVNTYQDLAYQRVSDLAFTGILNQNSMRNDQEFVTAMGVLGFEQVHTVNIRRLITSYIQATGVDPEIFLRDRSPEELSNLFSVKIPAQKSTDFAKLVSAYWRFQLEKLQTISGTLLKPDLNIVILSEQKKISSELLNRIAVATNELSAESYKEGYDPRLYALASLVTPTQLKDEVFIESLRLALRELVGDDPVMIERALQVVRYLHQKQNEQIATAVSQNFSRKETSNFYHYASRAAGTQETAETQQIDASYIEKLDLNQRRELIANVFSNNSPQENYILTNQYLDDQVQAILENDPLAFSDGLADDLLYSDQELGIDQRFGRGNRSIRQQLAQFRNARKAVSRINTLGKSVTAINTALKTASASNVLGAAAGFAAGKLAGAIVGKENGERIQQLVAIGSFGAAIASFASAIAATLGPFLVPILAIAGATGSAIIVSLTNGLSSVSGAVGSAGRTLAQPILGSAGAQATTAESALAPNALPTATTGSAASQVATTTPGTGVLTKLVGTPSVAAVATGGTVVGTICLAAVVTITTQGAFLDPARVAELTGEASPFVEIDKEVSPNAIDNNTPTTVSYTITITPKENYIITPIPGGTTDTISYLGGDPLNLTTPIDSIRQQLGTTPINPGESRQITYSFENVSGVDVQVTNFFTLAFTVEGEDGEQTLTKSAFLRIGNPQIGCFNFVPGGSTFVNITSIDWTEAEMAKIQEAFAPLANNATYMALLCSSGPIDLYRLEGSLYGGWAPRSMNGTALGIYDLGLEYEVASTRYTLVHELGHILDYRNSHLNPGFNSARTRSGCYSYPFPADCNPAEAFAEAVSLFVMVPGYERLAEWDLLTIDPPAYDWINQNIFGGEAISR